MIRGKDVWSKSDQMGMTYKLLNGHDVWTFNNLELNIYELLRNSANKYPESIAITNDYSKSITYSNLLLYVDRFAAQLIGLHIGKNKRVGLCLCADIEFVVAIFAVAKIGAISILLPTKNREPELLRLVASTKPDLLIVSEEYQHLFQRSSVCKLISNGFKEGANCFLDLKEPSSVFVANAECVHQDYNAPCCMLFTSGTTNLSKTVLLTHANIIHAARVYASLMRTTPDDRALIPLPIYYVTGLVALLMQFIYVGAHVYIQRKFNAQNVLNTCLQHDISYLHLTPSSINTLLALRNRYPAIPSLRVLLSGSSYESIAEQKRVHEWLPQTIHQMVYGMTETASPALLFPGDSATSIFCGATGKPIPGIDAQIIKDNGHLAKNNEVGELYLKGTCITPGYVQIDESDVLQYSGLSADGWLPTGDIAYANAEGMVWVIDRKKDLINRGGEKIWCSALEDIISSIDGVAEVCVAGIPDQIYGEVPVCAVVLQKGHSLDEKDIIAILKEQIASYKIPQKIKILSELPMSNGGKPQRKEVAALFNERINNEK